MIDLRGMSEPQKPRTARAVGFRRFRRAGGQYNFIKNYPFPRTINRPPPNEILGRAG